MTETQYDHVLYSFKMTDKLCKDEAKIQPEK